MKSNTLIKLIIILCSFQFGYSQVKNQHTLLQEIGDGSVFKEYYGITKEGDSYSGQANADVDIKFVNNIHNKLSAFELNKEGKKEVLINCGFGFLKPNHYTEPSLIYSKTHRLAYVYIDGLLYTLKNVSDANNVAKIELGNIYVLMKPMKGDHISGKAAIKQLKKGDHDAIIKKYLSDMKVVQDAATKSFSPEILAEIDAIENKNSADKKAIKDANDAYWQSAEGQRVLAANKAKEGAGNDGWFTIKNTGNERLYVITGSGTSSHIAPGGTNKWQCNTDIYYCYLDSKNTTYNVKGALIANGKQACGKTIEASASK
ncbi:MAG: hypothetical protein JNJ41_16265 [Bacteroidia bacterium]|nr:hypothetical protein [Bacteroidia bacterium]